MDFDDFEGFAGPADFSPPPMPTQAVPRETGNPEHGAQLPVQARPDTDFVATQGEPFAPGPQEHLSMGVPSPTNDVYGRPPMPMPMGPPPMPPGAPYYGQAVGQAPPMPVPTKSSKGLAATLVALGVGVAAGAKMGGWAGAGAGLLLAGGTVNAVRASRAYLQGTPGGDREGAITATYGLVGLGAGAAVAYKYVYEPHQAMQPNPGELVDEDDPSCDIRPVGP